MLGLGDQFSDMPILADGVNEAGLGAAVLYFPGYAAYPSLQADKQGKIAMEALDVVNFLLGVCGSLAEAKSWLQTITIFGVENSITHSVLPLHWLLADQSGQSMVVEQTQTGLHIYDNPVGVLTNGPDFPWHLTNLRNYLHLSSEQKQEAQWGDVCLTPFGQAAGAWGLPGDDTPPSRFVRAAFQKTHILPLQDLTETVLAGFQILAGVSIPKGVVMTQRQTPDLTQYTSFYDLRHPACYFRTMQTPEIIKAVLTGDLATAATPRNLGKLIRPTRFYAMAE